MSFLKKIFGRKSKDIQGTIREFTDEEFNLDYELKEIGLENVLGKMHEVVGHAIIPFSIGGAVDMYYFSTELEHTN